MILESAQLSYIPVLPEDRPACWQSLPNSTSDGSQEALSQPYLGAEPRVGKPEEQETKGKMDNAVS